MEYVRKCPICGSEFMARRSDALCCSSSCRKAKARRARVENDANAIIAKLRMAPPRPVKPKEATVENIADVVVSLKANTTALRHYAHSCPIPVRPVVLALAEGVDVAIKEVGL